MNEKTTSNNINHSTIIHFLLYHKSSKIIRDTYKLNTHHVTVLLACYSYSKFVKPIFTITNIRMFANYYSHHRLLNYINRLIDVGFINLSGRHYFITDTGKEIINQISINNDNILYSFCQKYNIEL